MYEEKPMGADAPPRRTGSRAGYIGKPELDAANARFRRAVSRLARDKDDQARVTGARIVAEATEVLLRLAADADDASSVTRARREQATKKLERLDTILDAARERASTTGN